MGGLILAKLEDAYFIEDGSTYVLGNSLIERRWSLEEGFFATSSLKNLVTGKEWCKDGPRACHDFGYEGLIGRREGGKLVFSPLSLENVSFSVEESGGLNPHLEVIFHLIDPHPGTRIRRFYRIFPDTCAMITWAEISTENSPSGDYFLEGRRNVMDFLPLSLEGVMAGRSVEFFTRTDVNNKLVQETLFTFAQAPPMKLNGNLLFLTDRRDGEGLFILKESPVSGDRRPEILEDFIFEEDGVYTFGWGIRPEEVLPNRFHRSYGVVTGLYSGDDDQGLLALKEYQMAKYRFLPERDYMVMANPWGDGGCYERLGEDFILEELEGCARIGATHYQIDDGWQRGGALIRIVNNEVIDDDFWVIDETRFPEAFTPLAQRASELGVNLALWFAPDRNRLYRNYKRDGQILWRMYEDFDIRAFKIDALNIQTKEAEENLESLLRDLSERSNGDISFNFDVTGALDRRPGYFYLQEYGNIFLENRYTRVKGNPSNKYYPFKTLRNLWQLASYVLPQKLQVEFLNIDLNRQNYAQGHELAPENYPWEYVFAITFFANPLLWGEPSGFSDEAVARIRPLIDLHKAHREDIFSCNIFSIGDMPDGYAWTGFQAHPRKKGRGFLIVYRERHPSRNHKIGLKFLEEGDYEFELITSSSPAPKRLMSHGGTLDCTLASMNSFALYTYVREP